MTATRSSAGASSTAAASATPTTSGAWPSAGPSARTQVGRADLQWAAREVTVSSGVAYVLPLCVFCETVAEPTKPSQFARDVVRPPAANGRIERSLVPTLTEQWPNSADRTSNWTQFCTKGHHDLQSGATDGDVRVFLLMFCSPFDVFSEEPAVREPQVQTNDTSHASGNRVRGVTSEP